LGGVGGQDKEETEEKTGRSFEVASILIRITRQRSVNLSFKNQQCAARHFAFLSLLASRILFSKIIGLLQVHSLTVAACVTAPFQFELVLALPATEQFKFVYFSILFAGLNILDLTDTMRHVSSIIAVDSGLALTAWSPSSSRGTTVTPIIFS
jgi:hypothetical protein